MHNFEFLLRPEENQDLIKALEEHSEDYDFWGSVDIIINGTSFFTNFKPSFYNIDAEFEKGIFNNSTVTSKGIFTPIFPFIDSILSAPNKLKEKGSVIIEDPTGQIDKEIFCLLKDNRVIFAVRQNDWDKEYTWYDGRKMVVSKEVPSSNINTVSFLDFSNGCISSIQRFLEGLEVEYHDIKHYKFINSLFKRVEIS